VTVLVVSTNALTYTFFSFLLVPQVIAAYLFGEQPHVEKAMQILQGVRASNFMVAYKTLSDLLTACWMANKVENANLLFQDMRSANYNIDGKVLALINPPPHHISWLPDCLSFLLLGNCSGSTHLNRTFAYFRVLSQLLSYVCHHLLVSVYAVFFSRKED